MMVCKEEKFEHACMGNLRENLILKVCIKINVLAQCKNYENKAVLMALNIHRTLYVHIYPGLPHK